MYRQYSNIFILFCKSVGQKHHKTIFEWDRNRALLILKKIPSILDIPQQWFGSLSLSPRA